MDIRRVTHIVNSGKSIVGEKRKKTSLNYQINPTGILHVDYKLSLFRKSYIVRYAMVANIVLAMTKLPVVRK